MRSLHLAPFYAAPGHGGMARAARDLSGALAARGHDVRVVTLRPGAGERARPVPDGVEAVLLDPAWRRGADAFPWPRGLGATLDAELGHCDVVHVHGVRSGFVAGLVPRLRRSGIPLVVQPHGTWPHHGQRRSGKRLFDALLGRRLLRAAGAVLAVSEAEARDLPGPARVVGNGVTRVGSGTPPAASAAPGPPRLLFVGSGRPQKGATFLASVLAELPDVGLDLVGPFGAGARRAFAALGDRVSFRGVLDGGSLADAYASATLLVHPARGEAFGLVAFEAALEGTAGVVAGDHGCAEWYARAGGCVAPVGERGAWLDALRARLSRPELRRREAEAVRSFAERELRWSDVAERVAGVYATLIPGDQ